MDYLDRLLGDFGHTVGFDDLTFADEECRLEIDGVVVDFIADRGRAMMVLSSYIAPIPAGDRAATLSLLLAANCGPDLAGGALGVPDGGEAVVLTTQIAAAGLDAARLADRIRLFLASAEFAQTLIAGAALALHPPQAAPIPDDTSTMIRV